jgi:hypothetical protein
LSLVALLDRWGLVRVDESTIAPKLARIDIPAPVLLRPTLSSFQENQRLVAAGNEVVWPRSRWKADEVSRFDGDSERTDTNAAPAAQDVTPLFLDRMTMPVRPRETGLDRADMDAHVRQARGIAGATDDCTDAFRGDEPRPLLAGQIPDVDDAGRTTHDGRTV